MLEVTNQIRNAWCNRPSYEMNLSLEEWIEGKRKGPQPIRPVETLVQTESGRTRHATGQMNGLEKRYAAHLEMRKVTGEIRDYLFEPLKLKLAPATFYNPDFGVWMPDGRIELHEVKGSFWEDDARCKWKIAAAMFPWFTFVAVQWNKAAKDWKYERFLP